MAVRRILPDREMDARHVGAIATATLLPSSSEKTSAHIALSNAQIAAVAVGIESQLSAFGAAWRSSTLSSLTS